MGRGERALSETPLRSSAPSAVKRLIPAWRGGSEGAASAILALGRAHGLSAYESAYLDLAMREDVALATRDRGLKAAAGRYGVALFETQA